MFTGIVEELGQVVTLERAAEPARLTIAGPEVTTDARRGDSIAINGVCLTVTAISGAQFSADVMGETLSRSSLGALTPGTPVNLERPVRPDGRLGGHIVQGHVDGTGVIVSRAPAGGWDVVRISVPAELSRYVVEKGSVAVDGVSLTVSALSPPAVLSPAAAPGPAPGAWFEVSLIPQTLQRTTLGTRQPGDVVNLEVDMIAKYVERLLAGRQL
ncbi:MAG: riboflavin synthase [Actinomycetota bacterium]|nr:riboflavin synthase [Actinomycetota bacterium]